MGGTGLHGIHRLQRDCGVRRRPGAMGRRGRLHLARRSCMSIRTASDCRVTSGPGEVTRNAERAARGREMHKQLWAPWRLAYVAAAKPPEEGDPCFICRGLAEKDNRANLIVLRTPLSVVVLNR